MENDSEEQKTYRPWLFQPGQSGNPGGRPKGSKSLKTYAKEMLMSLSDDEKLEFMKGLDKKIIWEMGEGKASQDVTSGGEPLQPILVKFIDGKTDDNRDSE